MRTSPKIWRIQRTTHPLGKFSFLSGCVQKILTSSSISWGDKIYRPSIFLEVCFQIEQELERNSIFPPLTCRLLHVAKKLIMMVPANEQKRKEREESTGLPPRGKKQKIPSSPSLNSRGEKVGATELASAFALASLASFNSPKKKDHAQTEARDAECYDESSTASLEARSPKEEPVPITPEMRSPARFNYSKKVTFAPDMKEPTRLGPRRYSIPPRLNSVQGSRMPFGFARNVVSSRVPIQRHSPRQQIPPPWMQHSPCSFPRAGMPQSPRQPAPSMPESEKWVCDFCNVSAFPTYHEACAHEASCRARYSAETKLQQLVPRYQPHGIWRGNHHVARHASYVSSYAHPMTPPTMMGFQSKITSIGLPVPVAGVNGPVGTFRGPVSLAIPESDSDWLSGHNCFIRKHCVEVFSEAAATSSHGSFSVGRVGIRCCFCKHRGSEEKEAAALSYPDSIAGIYESVKQWESLHLDLCKDVPDDVRRKLGALDTENAWIPTTQQYWTDSAKMLGMVDTADGIRFACGPSMNSSRGSVVGGMNHQTGEAVSSVMTESRRVDSAKAPSTGYVDEGEFIVFPQDTTMVPSYVYFLMRQVESCRFTEADRFVARSKGPVGYPGFQCRHCHGHAGLGKYFPVSSKSLATNSTSQNIHAHLLKCRKCPSHQKEQLVALKEEKSKAPRLEPGWRKIFFDKIWSRLHG